MDPKLLAELKERLGTTIGDRWCLEKLLGLGASAAVYRAVDAEGWRVAVKIMHSRFLRSKTVQQRFFREQQILDKVQHENTLRVFATERTPEGIPYIVMELLEGITLARLMHKRGEVPLEIDRVIEFTLPLLTALEVCHGMAIIHRDLKPANVFVTRERVVKLLDFGVARYHEDGVHLTRDGTALGTPAFMSPEQASGHMDLLDERSDLFSVGAMMHYLLSGKYLHQGKTAEETYIKAATTPASSLARRAPHLKPDIVRLVDRAVAWNPEDRWQTAADFSMALRALLEARKAAEGRQRVETLRGWSSVGKAALSRSLEQQAGKRMRRALLDVWQSIDRAMQTMQRYGAYHAMSLVRREEAFAITEAALEEGGGELYWDVRPYSFEIPGSEEEACWEPNAPLDRIPYELFASGVRRVRFDTKLTLESFLNFLETLTLDPDAELAPEDDLATAIWDRRLLGVELEIGAMSASVDMANHHRFERAFTNQLNAVGEAVRSEIQLEFERLQILEQLGEGALIEAEVMLTASPKNSSSSSPHADRSDTPGMEDEELLALRIAHRAQQESWVIRLGTTMGDLIGQARQDGDAARWIAPLGELSTRLARAGRPREFLDLFGVMMSQLRHPTVRHDLVHAAIDPEFLSQLFTSVGIFKRDHEVGEVELDQKTWLTLTMIVDHLGAPHFQIILDALGSQTPAAKQLHPALLECVRGRIEGSEGLLGEVLASANEELAGAIMELLDERGAAGIEALRAGLSNPHDAVRLAILERLASQGAQDINAVIDELSWSPSPRTRLQALQAVARLGLRTYIPNFIARMKHQDFHHFPLDERRLNFQLLEQISSAAAEQVAIELLGTKELLGGSALDATRVIAADYLGKKGTSQEAARALDAARRRRPWGSREVQEASQRAFDTLQARSSRQGGAT